MNFIHFIVLALCFIINTHIVKAQHKKPNIVLILADDLGFADIGVYGQQKIKTPNLDRLAQKGIKFTNFYTGTSVCAPSRASLLTGLHTGHASIRGNKEIEPEGQYPLPEQSITIAKLLKEQGYITGAFGKWGLGMVGTSGDPNHQGFDTFFGYNCQRQAHTYYPDHLWHNQTRIELPDNKKYKNSYAADIIHQETLDFIEKNQNKPFFLFVPTILPHAELAGPKDSLYLRYANLWTEHPFLHNHYAGVEKPRAMYASMVSRLDQHVGQILKKLEELELADNTLIMFCSDNGAHEEGGADPTFFNSSGIYRGIKRSLYEGGIRTPFIAYWPKIIKPGQVTTYRAAFWDIFPTLMEIASYNKKIKTDGISFKPTLYSKGKQKQHQTLYWEFHEEGGRQALLKGNWKLIVHQVKHPQKTFIELYNIKEDPSEQFNLASKKPKLVQKLTQQIQRERVENPDFPLTSP